MAIWDNLLKKLVQPIVDEAVEEKSSAEKIEKNKPEVVADNLNKVLMTFPTGNARVVPDTSNNNSKIFARGVTFSVLREFSKYYPILRACINYRKRQISQLDWNVSTREVVLEKTKKEKYTDDAKRIKSLLRYPAGDKSMTFSTFINKLLEDLLVLDAIAIYKRKNRANGIYGYLPVDASTINLVLHEDGTTPTPPQSAYAQIINGRKTADLTLDEMIYRAMNPRTDSPYGQSPVESLILTVSTALKLSSYNLSYLTEGNVPEGFVALPKDIASDPDQLQAWQSAWDAMFSGDPRYQRKIKFLPEGMVWTPIRKQDDMEFERFEKWLLQCTCSVMEVPPQAIGFQFERGKGATEAEWDIGKEKGLYPTAALLKEIMDQIIQDDLGQDHLEFVWTNINPTNSKEEADVFDTLVRTGAVSVDEYRIAEGMEPIGLPNYIMSPVGPILVRDLITASEQGRLTTEPMQPLKPGQSDPNLPAKPVEDAQTVQTKEPVKDPKPSVAEKINLINREDVVEELKRWKKSAINDYKQGKEFRDFKTDVVDYRTQRLIKNGLKNIKNRDELNELFDPFINQESQMVNAMLDLYEEVSNTIEARRNANDRTAN